MLNSRFVVPRNPFLMLALLGTLWLPSQNACASDDGRVSETSFSKASRTSSARSVRNMRLEAQRACLEDQVNYKKYLKVIQEYAGKAREEGIAEGEIRGKIGAVISQIRVKRSKWSLLSSSQQQQKLEGVASTFMLPQGIVQLLWEGKEDEAREQAMKESIHTTPETLEVPVAAVTHPELPPQDSEPPSGKHQTAKRGRSEEDDAQKPPAKRRAGPAVKRK